MDKVKILSLARLIAKFAEVSTDKGTLISDGELAVGVEVFQEVDGEIQAASDGEYVLENGDVVVVAEGKVSEIRKKEVEEEETVEEEVVVEATKKDKFDAVKAQFEASYQEVEANIYAALNEAGVWGYLIENGNDYAIVAEWNEEDQKEHLFRYAISINEEGYVTLGEKKEVRVEYVDVDEPKEEDKPKEEEVVEEEVKEEVKEEEFEKETPAFREVQNDETTATVSLAEVVKKYNK